MRALLLVAALTALPVVAGTPGDQPRMRCAACSLLPAGATGSDLALSGTMQALTYAKTGATAPLTGLQFSGLSLELVSNGNVLLHCDSGTGVCNDNTYGLSGLTVTGVAASGSNALAVSTNGARTDFGAGASDYASSDGTTVTFAGPVTTTGLTTNAAANSAHLVLRDTTNSRSFTQIINNTTWTLYNNSNQQLLQSVDDGTLKTAVGTPAAASTFANVGGAVNVTTADVTSSGASNLISYTLPANALVVTNRCLRIKGWGTALNNANAKTVALDFGSQTIISKILTVSIASTTWSFQATVCRSGSNTQDIYAEAFNPMGTTVSSVDANTVLYQAARTAGTQTETATIVIKGKTTTATTTDVTMDGLTVEFM
jgi:hypothetical protein